MQLEQTAEQLSGVSIGKFNSVGELFKAYVELEREFTKRCQQLKEANKRCEPSRLRSSLKDRCERLQSLYPNAEAHAPKIVELLKRDSALRKSEHSVEEALITVLAGLVREPSAIAGDEKFRENYVYNNPEIRQIIIDGYLDEIKSHPLPKNMKRAGAIAVTPPHRPNSICEAGGVVRKMINMRRM